MVNLVGEVSIVVTLRLLEDKLSILEEIQELLYDDYMDKTGYLMIRLETSV